ncbi:protein kinase [Kovacikia minuta CCNUW1]|uniref:protein kinase domain-containing protein n=1 Tax=Kovacikia minuta TaxID=2931930 RepID=UPI001CCA93BC|nr:protein kinase [Kovacikia minuta]UBF25348.1 protein kinase [Kovacikia minuta CCNUW1]
MAVIMVTDGVGCNARMADDPEHTLSLIRRDLQLMQDICQRFEGQVLRLMGEDGLMVYFGNALQAVACAIEIQKALAYVAASLPDVDVLAHRIGIHFGEVFFDQENITGNGVKIAIRLQEETTSRGVCLSQTVYDAVKGRLSLEATHVGSLSFRNIQEPVQAYQIFPASHLSGGLSASEAPEDELTLGTLVNNRYRVERVLGHGGFGRTYLASDTHCFGDFCVLKEFVPSSRSDYVVQKSRELFEREARVLYQINHPQIPRFLAWLGDRGRLFLVQEYIDGKTYAALIQERHNQGQSAFSEAEVIQWMKDLLPVLDYLHSLNILHRDISPENVMLPDGQAKPVLIDFGLVKQTVSQILASHTNSGYASQASVVGKFGYSPPEQIRMGRCFPCSDLYALAVSAIVLLTGCELSLLMDYGSLEWKWHSYVNISDRLLQLLNRMLAEKPRERYQSASEVLAELQKIAPDREVDRQPLVDISIQIDQEKRRRQVAEIMEGGFFQELMEQADDLRDDFFDLSTFQEQADDFQDDFFEISGLREEGAFEPQPTMLVPRQTDSPEPPTVIAPAASGQPQPAIPFDSAFLEHCRQELAGFIGPMAGLILKNVLAEQAPSNPQQLVEALAAKIPGSPQAQMFRSRVRIPGEQTTSGASGQPESGGSGRPESGASGQVTKRQISESRDNAGTIANSPAASSPGSTQLTPAFLDTCRQELARHIGPIANFMVQDMVKRQPQITAQQLIDTLSTTIPTLQQADAFKRQLSKLI